MSTKRPTRAGHGVYMPPNARGSRGKPSGQQDIPRVAAGKSDTNSSSAVRGASTRLRDEGAVKGTTDSHQCAQKTRGTVDTGREIREGAGNSHQGNANDATISKLVAESYQATSAVETAAPSTAAGYTRASNLVYTDGRNNGGKDPPPAPICDSVDTKCSLPTDAERSDTAVNAAESSNNGDASREVVAMKNSADGGRSTRRKPRKAWSQYMPPTRRDGGDNEGAATIAANPSIGLTTSPTRRPPVTPARNNLSPTPLEDTAATAAATSSLPPPEEHSQPMSSPELYTAAGNFIQASNAERERGIHDSVILEPRSDHRSTDEIEVKLEALSVASASIERQKNAEGEAAASDVEAEDVKVITNAAVDGGMRTADVQCETSGEVNSKAAAASAVATEAAEAKNDVVAEGNSVEENRGEMSTEEGDSKKTPVKTVSTPYVPPGRRRMTESAPQNDREPMGPLWPSGGVRTPVRVSQRARASDGGSSPSRPTPSRVAAVVGGGKSAYGANIEEYSEQMSRGQVEACTALITNFPKSLPPGQREELLRPFTDRGALVVWPRPDEALATFATPTLARQAISSKNSRSTILTVELLSEARQEKRRALQQVELARPGRPPADVSSASRITLAALGIRKPREKKAGTPTSARKGLKAAATASGKSGGVRGRGARPQEPAESTDSWDM